MTAAAPAAGEGGGGEGGGSSLLSGQGGADPGAQPGGEAGAGGQPAPQPSGQGGGGQPGPKPPEWAQTFESEELREFVTGKQYASPEAAVHALKHATQKLSKNPEQLADIPTDWSNPDQVAKFRAQIGVPEGPAGYDVKNVPNDPQAKAFVEGAKAKAHELGLRPEQVQGLVDWSQQLGQLAEQESARVRQEQQSAELGKIRQDWGQEFEAKVQRIDANLPNVLSRIGLTPEMVQAAMDVWGVETTYRWADALVESAMGETALQFGGAAGGGAPGTAGFMDARGAQAQANQLMRDPDFVKRYNAGEPAAVAQMHRLTEIASSDPEASGRKILR